VHPPRPTATLKRHRDGDRKAFDPGKGERETYCNVGSATSPIRGASLEHSGATAAQEFPLASRPTDGRVVLRTIAALLLKLAPRLPVGPFYCGLSMHAVTSRTSWYEVLPQGLGHSMGAIAYVKFDLDLLQVAADRSAVPLPLRGVGPRWRSRGISRADDPIRMRSGWVS
jgi:hypothetical protein